MSVCFIGGAKVAILAIEMFAVAWSPANSEEEWRRVYDVAPGAIVTRDLRARNVAEGGALLPGSTTDGDWHVWRSGRRSFPAVSFGSEPGARNWRICTGDTCTPLTELTGAPEGTDITAVPCKADPQPAK